MKFLEELNVNRIQQHNKPLGAEGDLNKSITNVYTAQAHEASRSKSLARLSVFLMENLALKKLVLTVRCVGAMTMQNSWEWPIIA